ncbi:CPBP family intramembrane metalloprotease [bacterium]|nr:CPBP family intramembrane metalloprotease [bacterium]
MHRNSIKIILFIGLTFFFCWLMVALFFVFGGKWDTPASFGMIAIYMFMPMVVAIIVQKFIYKEPLKEPLGISFKLNRWFVVAWLLPPVLAFATLGVSLLFPGVEYSTEMAGMFERFKSLLTPEQLAQMESQTSTLPIHPIWLTLLQGLVAGVTINAIFGFGEELGWRGLLQRELGYLEFWKSSVIIGAIWGIWHAPIILQGHNYPEHPVAGVFMMTIWCILLAPIFSYVRLKAQSVIAAAIIHGSFNATAGLAVIVVKGGSDLLIGVTGLAGFIVLLITNIGLFSYDKFSTTSPKSG